jgi:flagellin
MSNDISLSAGSRSALTSLQTIQSQMDVLQKRLSTGKKVNSPIDNPTAFFLASSLTNRATQIGALADSLQNATSTIDAANNGLAAIQSLLTSAQSLANQALQSSQSLTSVNGVNSNGFTVASTIASTAGSASRLKSGDTVTVSDGTTTATYTAANGDTIQTLLNAVNGTSNLKIGASLNSAGQLKFTATSNVNITIGGTFGGAGTLSSVLGLSAGTTNYTTNATRSNLAAQFDSLRTQIDQAAQDSGFNGVNLLTGSSLSVTLNERGTSSMTVAGSSTTSSGLGVSASGNTWQLDTDINTSLSAISTAINTLQSTSTTFSSLSTVMSARSDFNNAMIDTLNEGADSLTRNDSSADGAMLLALQTRQQVAATALSLAQGSESVALKLFGY